VNGRTLSSQLVTGTVRSLIDHTVGMKVAAVLVIAMELALAATVWMRRTWIVAAPLGIALHLAIYASKLEIGLFAYLMLGLYVLIVPDRVWVALAAWLPLARLRRGLRAIAGSRSWFAWVAGLAAGFAVAALTRFENGLLAGGIATATTLAIGLARAVWGQRRIAVVGAAHVAAIGLWWMVDRTTSVTSDYYRFWAGSQRRLGNLGEAERALRTWLDHEPDDGAAHFQLGRVLLARDRAEDGIAELHRAQQLEPARARAWLEEARWLARQGKTNEAIAKAREAAFAEPSSGDARALLGSLTGGRGIPAAGATGAAGKDDDTETP
jgi:tetratricopeptide (TPR) repeat protein